jgi:AcrR family transcriptional regulator
MSVDLGLRERKKLRTKRALSDIALSLFARQGFDATTVEEICERAEVSRSTFFRYFATKEAAAFPDEDLRIAIVEQVLREHPAGEPWNVTIRRSVMALIDYDLDNRKDFRGRIELMNREPALAAHAMKVQAATADRYTRLLAEAAGLDPATDLRPGLVVAAAFAAVNSAWSAWLTDEAGRDLRDLVGEAFDLLDGGLATALPH